MQTEQFQNPYSTLVLYTNRTSSREQEMVRLNFNEQQIVPILLLNQLHLCSKLEQSIFQRNVLIVQIIWLLFQMSLYPIIEEQAFILEIFYYNSEYQPFYYVVLLIWVGSFLLLHFSDSIRQKPIYANIFTTTGVVFYSIFMAIQYYNNRIILQIEYLLLTVLAIQIIYLQIRCIKFTLLSISLIQIRHYHDRIIPLFSVYNLQFYLYNDDNRIILICRNLCNDLQYLGSNEYGMGQGGKGIILINNSSIYQKINLFLEPFWYIQIHYCHFVEYIYFYLYFMKTSYDHLKMDQEVIQTGIPVQNIQLQPTNVQPNFVEGNNNLDNNNEQVGNVIAEDALIQGLAPYLQNIFLSKIAVIWFIQEVLMVLVCTKFHNFSVNSKNSLLETLMLYLVFLCLVVFIYKVRFGQLPQQGGEQLKLLIIFTLGYCLFSVLYLGEISGFSTFYYFIIIGNCISFFEIILITLVCPNGQYYKKFLIAQLIFQVIPLILFALRLFYYEIFEGILIPFAVLCFGFGMVICTTLTGLYLLYSVDTLLKGKFQLRRNQSIIGAVLAFGNILL